MGSLLAECTYFIRCLFLLDLLHVSQGLVGGSREPGPKEQMQKDSLNRGLRQHSCDWIQGPAPVLVRKGPLGPWWQGKPDAVGVGERRGWDSCVSDNCPGEAGDASSEERDCGGLEAVSELKPFWLVALWGELLFRERIGFQTDHKIQRQVALFHNLFNDSPMATLKYLLHAPKTPNDMATIVCIFEYKGR